LPFDSALNEEVSGNSTWLAISGVVDDEAPMLSGNYAAASFNVQSSEVIAIGAQDFTIEGWCRPTNSNSNYQTLWYTPGAAVYYRNGKIHWYQGGIRCESASLTIGTTYHFMATRESGTVRLFINGVESATDYSASPSIATNGMSVGVNTAYGEPSDCDQDEVRITIGVARETANFTPRTTPFPRSGP
jgi:hypothetical protein